MTETAYRDLMRFTHHGGFLKPANEKAQEYIEILKGGEEVLMKDATSRDISFHKAYFSMLAYCWEWTTTEFKNSCPRSLFYYFLKELKGDFTIQKVGKKEIKRYTSIAFGNMSQKRFAAYVREQIAFIYSDVISPLYNDEQEKMIIENIEYEYEKFLSKL